MNLRINDLSRYAIVAKDCKVNDGLAIASLIRRSQAQCGAGYSINLFEDFNMIFQFFSSSRHLGFEDVQAMVYLIGDAVQISGLFISSILNNLFIYLRAKLHKVCIFPCTPLASPSFAGQSVEAQPILRCNEATTLASNEVSFYCFPVYSQGFRHKPSLYTLVHKVNASLNHRFLDSMHVLHNELSPSSPLPFGSFPKGEGEPQRIRSMTTNPNQRSNK